MELEAIEPSHCGFARCGRALEDPVGFYALVLAHPYRCRIDKGDSGARARTIGFQEDGQRHHHALAELHKTVIGHRFGKIILHMPLDVENIIVFEAFKTTDLEQ